MVLTEDGTAARLVAKYRPPCPVIAVSTNPRTLRSLAVTFGLIPCQVRRPHVGANRGALSSLPQPAAGPRREDMGMAGAASFFMHGCIVCLTAVR